MTTINVTVAAKPQVVAAAHRTISGRILPWDEYGRTSYGALVFPRGTITTPEDVTEVKLLAGHSPDGIPVGHATSIDDRDDGLYATFQLGSHEAADQALQLAEEKVVDALSIEAYAVEHSGPQVTSSMLSSVALVPTPAFQSARIDSVHAEADSPLGSGDDTTPPADHDTKDTEMKHTLTPGVMPGTPTAAPATMHASLTDVVRGVAAAVRGDDTLLAELTDITDSGMVDRAAPAWLGELWSGVTYQRRIIPLLTHAALTSRKAIGYQWKTKPGVATYKGDKTDIPSKPAEIQAVERDATRWAGGNDLDRAFWDFGETEFLAAYWRAMAESYAFETDQAAGKFLVDKATAIPGTAVDVIRAIARGAIVIDQALHTPATFAIIHPADFEGILSLSELDAPKYLSLVGGIHDPSKWVTSEFVPKGTVVMGTKSAVTHYELAGSPLRVEAEHIARGGRDAALFGYTALMVNKPEGLIKITFDRANSLPDAIQPDEAAA